MKRPAFLDAEVKTSDYPPRVMIVSQRTYDFFAATPDAPKAPCANCGHEFSEHEPCEDHNLCFNPGQLLSDLWCPCPGYDEGGR